LSNCFDELMRQLDRIIPHAAVLSKPIESLDANERDLVEELNLALQSMHYLRSFVARKTERGVEHIFVGMTEKISETLDEKYDSLLAVWCLQLARRRWQDLLNATVFEMTTFKTDRALSETVNHLIGNGLLDAIFGITAYLINNGHTQSALKIALQIAKDHTFEAKTIATQIIKDTHSASTLRSLIIQCVEVSEKLADMIVRHLALSDRAPILKEIAKQLALEGEGQALSLVLSQLVSTDEHFLSLVASLCDTVPDQRIAVVGEWLAKTGMTSVIRQKISLLT